MANDSLAVHQADLQDVIVNLYNEIEKGPYSSTTKQHIKRALGHLEDAEARLIAAQHDQH